MRSERFSPIKPLIAQLHLDSGSLAFSRCDNPVELLDCLSPEDARRSFPPDGIPLVSELDTFFRITTTPGAAVVGNGVAADCQHGIHTVGFYRVEDLFFDGEIELHGSFAKHDSFLVRSYFNLTTLFVKSFVDRFPQKTICTTVLKENAPVRAFLRWLKFEETAELSDNNAYIRYELRNRESYRG